MGFGSRSCIFMRLIWLCTYKTFESLHFLNTINKKWNPQAYQINLLIIRISISLATCIHLMFLKLKIMKNLYKRLMPLIILSIFIGTGCLKDTSRPESHPSSQPSLPLNVDLVHVAYHIEDAKKESPSGEATMLWNNRGHTPIMAPDGHQVTFGEFNTVSGKAEITYLQQGSKVALSLQGLIPNGVYSIWVLTFQLPGYHGTFANLIGNGALGSNDGSQNTFRASFDGTAFLSTIMYAESLSIFGSVGNCLCSEYEVHIVAAYHSTNLINRDDSGNPDSWVAQFAFQFRGGH
jgi:hypothetical protein